MPGLDAKIRKMAALHVAKRMAIKKHVIETAVRIQTQAKLIHLPHRDTGVLGDNMDMSPTIMDENIAEAKVHNEVEYAGYHEAQFPYLDPAAAAEEENFKAGLKKIISS